MADDLSAKQAATLRFIASYWLRYKRAPTIRKIGSEFGINSASSLSRVRRLRAAGLLEDSRSAEVTKAGWKWLKENAPLRCGNCGTILRRIA